MTTIIRIHTGEDGVVYARLMDLAPPFLQDRDEPVYMFREMVAVPEGLTQQEAVDHFQSQGWTVEQDKGYYDWEGEKEQPMDMNDNIEILEPRGIRDPRACVLCGGPVEPWPSAEGEAPLGYGHNPEPLANYEAGRACDACNTTRVIPERIRRMTEGTAPRG